MNTNNDFGEVFFKLSRLMRDDMTFTCYSAQLSILQLHALIYLKKNNPVQMSDIAQNFRIEMPTATSLLNKLVALKLVKRTSDIKDRRIVHIELTSKGEEVLLEAKEQHNKKIARMMTYLSEQDKQKLLVILQRIVATMEKAHEK
jgi:DNA-binding MarR family transcriptional regulator